MVDYIKKIAQAGEIEIEQLLSAIRQRYAELFPDRELTVFSLSKTADPNEQLDRIIDLLEATRSAYTKNRKVQ